LKTSLIILSCLIILFSLTTFAYSKKEEECSCTNQNTSLSEAIRSDMADVFDTQTGFAANGLSFVDNLPENLGGAGIVSSPDITLTEPPAGKSGSGKFRKGGGKDHHVPGCRNCELVTLDDLIVEPPIELP